MSSVKDEVSDPSAPEPLKPCDNDIVKPLSSSAEPLALISWSIAYPLATTLVVSRVPLLVT